MAATRIITIAIIVLSASPAAAVVPELDLSIGWLVPDGSCIRPDEMEIELSGRHAGLGPPGSEQAVRVKFHSLGEAVLLARVHVDVGVEGWSALVEPPPPHQDHGRVIPARPSCAELRDFLRSVLSALIYARAKSSVPERRPLTVPDEAVGPRLAPIGLPVTFRVHLGAGLDDTLSLRPLVRAHVELARLLPWPVEIAGTVLLPRSREIGGRGRATLTRVDAAVGLCSAPTSVALDVQGCLGMFAGLEHVSATDFLETLDATRGSAGSYVRVTAAIASWDNYRVESGLELDAPWLFPNVFTVKTEGGPVEAFQTPNVIALWTLSFGANFFSHDSP